MDKLSQYPKYQYSFFMNGRDSAQIVVRGDNFEDFVLDIEKVKTQFTQLTPLKEEKPLVAHPAASNDPAMCLMHNVVMKERINKETNSKFHSHYIGKYPDGSWCSGKIEK